MVLLLVDEVNRADDPALCASEAIALLLSNGTRSKARARELLLMAEKVLEVE